MTRVSGRELHKYPPLIATATSGASDVHLHDTFTAPFLVQTLITLKLTLITILK
jgi:hypothetical protein